HPDLTPTHPTARTAPTHPTAPCSRAAASLQARLRHPLDLPDRPDGQLAFFHSRRHPFPTDPPDRPGPPDPPGLPHPPHHPSPPTSCLTPCRPMSAVALTLSP